VKRLSILVADAGPLVGLELGETRAFLSPEQARHMADLLRSASFRTREDERPRTMPGAEHVEHIELPAKYIGENGDPAAADGKPL
jgi:hypothetical protein